MERDTGGGGVFVALGASAPPDSPCEQLEKIECYPRSYDGQFQKVA